MTLTSKIAALFSRGKKSLAPTTLNLWDVELQNIRRALGAVDTSVQAAYMQNDAVFAVVSRFVIAFQEPPILVYDANNEIASEHPVRAILASPNPDASESELYAQIAMYWATGGIAYLHKLRNANGRVVGLRAYSASQMTPEYRNATATAYRLNYAGESVSLPVADVIPVPYPIRDEYGRGIPPFLPCMLQVMTDSEATRYLYAVLKNDAVPRTVISTNEIQLGNKQREILKNDFLAAHGGVNKGAPIILPPGASIERISLSLQELTLDALRKVPEARLCAALGIPPEVVGLGVGLENSTYSNKREARKLFVESTLSAYWTYCAEAIERGLAQELGEGYELGFDLSAVTALQENQEEKEKRVITAWEKGIITRNEARNMMGLETLEGQDVFSESRLTQTQPELKSRLPAISTFQVIQSNPLSAAVETREIGEKSYCGGEDCEGENCLNVCPKNAEFYRKDIVLEWKKLDAEAESFTATLEKLMQPVFDALEAEILRNVRRNYKGWKALDVTLHFFDVESFRRALENATSAELQAFLIRMARLAAQRVAADWSAIESDFADALARLFGVSIDKITQVSERLRAELRDFLKNIAERPIEEITEQLRQQFGAVLGSPARVARIARTTATAAVAGAQRETWQLLGIKYVWLTQRDNRVRDAHRAMDGRETDADGLFRYVENGKTIEGLYPGNMNAPSGSVNCRCYLRPVQQA